ncbi:MAG: hypothetical protein GXO35_06440 [Gammaproteobacteria bacterium]|nr:hypothetical protein [Gammaproteobacteria bacterium]
MNFFNRATLMKAHALLAAMILPAALMFFITGALYTWGVKGGYETTSHEVHLKTPLTGQLGEMVTLAEAALAKQAVAVPSGHAKIKKIGEAFKLEWTGSQRDVVLVPTADPLIATLQIKNTSGYRQFVQLHKAKGGTPFKVYAAVFATALMLILFSGFMMAWKMPNLRKLTIMSTSFGVVLFAAVVMSS